MNNRQWRLMYNHFGHGPATLLILFGVAIVGLNTFMAARLLGIVTAHNEQATVLASLKANMQLLPQRLAERDSIQTKYSAVSSRLVSNADAPANAGATFTTTLKSWYSSQGVDQSAIVSSDVRDEAEVRYLVASVEAPMSPEKLWLILQNWSSAPIFLRLTGGTIELDDPISPHALKTRMVWESIRGPLPPPKAIEGKSGKPTVAGSDGKRTVVRSATKTTQLTEETRK